jgi:uncharacterized membrane protein
MKRFVFYLSAYFFCVAVWVVADWVMDQSESMLLGDFFRLPPKIGLALAGCHSWCEQMDDRPFWSLGTILVTGYAALVFSPLAVATASKRASVPWFAAVFVLIHFVLWVDLSMFQAPFWGWWRLGKVFG